MVVSSGRQEYHDYIGEVLLHSARTCVRSCKLRPESGSITCNASSRSRCAGVASILDLQDVGLSVVTCAKQVSTANVCDLSALSLRHNKNRPCTAFFSSSTLRAAKTFCQKAVGEDKAHAKKYI